MTPLVGSVGPISCSLGTGEPARRKGQPAGSLANAGVLRASGAAFHVAIGKCLKEGDDVILLLVGEAEIAAMSIEVLRSTLEPASNGLSRLEHPSRISATRLSCCRSARSL